VLSAAYRKPESVFKLVKIPLDALIASPVQSRPRERYHPFSAKAPPDDSIITD
jgi:hypothetical protein